MADLIIKLIKRDEGYRKSAYKDSLGYLTIGIGRLIDAKRGGGVTLEEAEYLLGNDIDRIERELDFHIPWWPNLDPVRIAILFSMAFQLGVPGLLSFKNTLRAVSEGRYADAADLMLKSKWASQTPERAVRLSRAMRSGKVTDLELED